MTRVGSVPASTRGSPRRRWWALTLAGLSVTVLVVSLLAAGAAPRDEPGAERITPAAPIPPWSNWTCDPEVAANEAPAALDIPGTNPARAEAAGATLQVVYEFEVYNSTISPIGSILSLPTAKAVLPTTGSGSLSLTFASRNVTVTGLGWSSSTLLRESVPLTSNYTFSSASAYLTTSKAAVMSNSVRGTWNVSFRWAWNFTAGGGLPPQNGTWTVPSITSTGTFLPSIFLPAPYIGILSTSGIPATTGTVFQLNLNGTVGSTSFRIVLEWTNGTEIQSIWENTSADATVFAATVPLVYSNGTGVAPGNYIIHVHNVCESIVHILPIQVVKSSPGSGPSPFGPSVEGIPVLLIAVFVAVAIVVAAALYRRPPGTSPAPPSGPPLARPPP
jgi:hypothetical protein